MRPIASVGKVTGMTEVLPSLTGFTAACFDREMVPPSAPRTRPSEWVYRITSSPGIFKRTTWFRSGYDGEELDAGC